MTRQFFHIIYIIFVVCIVRNLGGMSFTQCHKQITAQVWSQFQGLKNMIIQNATKFKVWDKTLIQKLVKAVLDIWWS